MTDIANRGTRLPGAPDPDLMIPASGGVRVAADLYGEEGPLVVLQHGGGQTRHAWKGAGHALAAAGYRAVSLDTRGHGDSDWAVDGDYGTDALVADLRAVLTHLAHVFNDGAEPAAHPVLVGASLGGTTSLLAAGEGVVDARAVVLVDVAPRIEMGGVQKIRAFMNQAPDGFASLEEVAAAIANYQPHRPRPRSLDGLAKNVRLWPDGRYRWHWDPGFMRRGRDIEGRTPRLEAAARALRMPTLLVRGGLSDVLSEEGAQAFLALAPHARYANVGDAAHMVAGDRNDLFVDAVVDFLTDAAV
ncbi:MAG: alpha/beta hydrolase [Actinomycetota bacterium]